MCYCASYFMLPLWFQDATQSCINSLCHVVFTIGPSPTTSTKYFRKVKQMFDFEYHNLQNITTVNVSSNHAKVPAGHSACAFRPYGSKI